MAFTFPPRLQLAQLPTPLQLLRGPQFRNTSAPRIWIKRDDLSGGVLSGNKVRKLEFVLAEAVSQGCDTVITTGGVQSNHCRATVIAAAQLGMKSHLILRGGEPDDLDGNLLLDLLCGAELSFYPRSQFSQLLDERFEQLQADYEARGHTVMCIPTGASNGLGIWGYLAACEELLVDFDQQGIAPSHIVTATGSGGTQAGLTQGMAQLAPEISVWGINVCDDEAWFMNKVAEDIAEWKRLYPQGAGDMAATIRVIDGYVGAGYGRASEAVFKCIVDLARSDGIVLDPVYTGKAFHGMCEEIEAGRFDDADDIVFIHTGGVFGLFPQREQLRTALNSQA